MKFSVGVEYALHCLLYMVNFEEGKSIGIRDLATFQGISESYLSKVYAKLSKAGIIKSVSGVKGGYALSYNLLTDITALENVVLSMNISAVKCKDKRKKALEILEVMGVDDKKANRKILKLSGGEQQRVGIARALSHNPNIIIADEPTGNLDKDTEEEIMNIFMRLAQ